MELLYLARDVVVPVPQAPSVKVPLGAREGLATFVGSQAFTVLFFVAVVILLAVWGFSRVGPAWARVLALGFDALIVYTWVTEHIVDPAVQTAGVGQDWSNIGLSTVSLVTLILLLIVGVRTRKKASSRLERKAAKLQAEMAMKAKQLEIKQMRSALRKGRFGL